MASQGASADDIAKAAGTSRMTVTAWLKRLGVDYSFNKSKLLQKENQILSMLAAGITQKNIRKTGISAEFIKKVQDRHGIKRPDRADVQLRRVLSEEEVLKRLPANDGNEYRLIALERAKTSGIKYVILCKDGFVFKKSPCHLYQGRPPTRRNETDVVLAKAKDLGYEVTKYTYGKIKEVSVTMRCLKSGHTRHLKRVENLYSKYHQKCPGCLNNGTSTHESDLRKEIDALGFISEKFYFKKTGKGRRKEIDIFIKEKQVGIEYCGLFWHGTASNRIDRRHHDKFVKATAEGVQLLTIFEDEWLLRRPQVMNLIKSRLGVFENKVFARKCKIAIITQQQAVTFHEANHIQGGVPGLLHIGLFHEDSLVAAMSFSRHHRVNDGAQCVLSRFSVKDGWSVPGGASKMLSHAITNLKEKGFCKIVTWSDNRFSNGNVYFKMGFLMDREYGPDYSYTKNQKRYSKQSMKIKPEERSLGKTEFELRTEQGLRRVWDCGKKRFVLDISPSPI